MKQLIDFLDKFIGTDNLSVKIGGLRFTGQWRKNNSGTGIVLTITKKNTVLPFAVLAEKKTVQSWVFYLATEEGLDTNQLCPISLKSLEALLGFFMSKPKKR